MWGEEFIQFLAALATLPRTIFNHQIIIVQFILFFKTSQCKTASAARNWINSATQTAATTFAFSSVFILRLCWDRCCMAQSPEYVTMNTTTRVVFYAIRIFIWRRKYNYWSRLLAVYSTNLIKDYISEACPSPGQNASYSSSLLGMYEHVVEEIKVRLVQITNWP